MSYGKASMEAETERAVGIEYGRPQSVVDAPVWPRVRNILILAGDVVGVVVLIVAVALIGSHGTALDFMTVFTDR
ncbi:hypothetical protein V7968_34640 [Nocardia vulneris]|uniref:hypothetical protein n=1 Tax=Nocardia vulneris TaxID=1141657 RepID=UPI0030CE474D